MAEQGLGTGASAPTVRQAHRLRVSIAFPGWYGGRCACGWVSLLHRTPDDIADAHVVHVAAEVALSTFDDDPPGAP